MTDLDRYTNSIAAMFEPVLELCEEEGQDGEAAFVPPWGRLLNPELCPAIALPYLAQFVGVSIPTGASAVEGRALVKAESGLERGTLAALRMAIERTLPAGAHYLIQERTEANGTEGAYHFNVIVETGKSTQPLFEAINAVIPAGIWYSVLEVTGAWLEGTKIWSAVTAGKTWATIKEGEY